MNKKNLDFLRAFADIYGYNKLPATTVLEYAADFLNSDEYMEDFMFHYHLVNHFELLHEVKELTLNGYDFFAACAEWDVWVKP